MLCHLSTDERAARLAAALADARHDFRHMLAAQLAALEAVRAGAACADVDAVARGIIADAGYGDAFAQAAAEAVDIVVCYADGRNDYEAAWVLPTGEADPTGKAGMGRTDSIWNELNVIGVTPGIYNDTVSITKANADVYNPEFIAAMQQALINVINTPEGQEIFSVYSHTGYAIAKDSDYDGARAALEVVS